MTTHNIMKLVANRAT